MTPPWAEELVLVCDVTWALTPPRPDNVSHRKWNWSAVPLMPLPPPWIAQVPLPASNDWLPAGVGLPMSEEFQPAGESFVHITRAELDWKVPTVVTVATTTSSPC